MKYKKNMILKTKDGRILGNAIIQRVLDNETFPLKKKNGYTCYLPQTCYIIKTDYGNILPFTDEEIDECFYEPYLQPEEEIALRSRHKNSC